MVQATNIIAGRDLATEIYGTCGNWAYLSLSVEGARWFEACLT